MVTMHVRTPMAGRFALLAVGLIATATACSGSGSKALTPSTASPPNLSTSTVKGSPDPNAPETNDPGDIPDNQAFVTYSPPGSGYSVKVPEGWARSEAGAVTFTDKFNSIRMESATATAAPTVSSATGDEVPRLRQSEKAFVLGKVSTVTRRSGSMVLITYEANSEPNPVTGKSLRIAVERYEAFKDGKLVTLTLTGAKGADNVDPWRTVTDGFSWTA